MNVAKYIAGQFGHPTGIGGQLATMIMNLLNRKLYRVCRDIVAEHSPDKILDIGFGNGYALAYLLRRAATEELYGIDISSDALKMAKHKLGPGAELSVGNIESLNFESDFFDLVYTINTFYFWQNPSKALSEVKRVMNRGGIFLNMCYTKEYLNKLRYTDYGFTKMNGNEILALHRQAGFSTARLIEIDKGKSFYIICEK